MIFKTGGQEKHQFWVFEKFPTATAVILAGISDSQKIFLNGMPEVPSRHTTTLKWCGELAKYHNEPGRYAGERETKVAPVKPQASNFF